MRKKAKEAEKEDPLLGKVSLLIHSAKGYVNKTINRGMLVLYWQIGKTLQEEFVKDERAEYGKRIVQTLPAQLVQFLISKFYTHCVEN